MSREFDKLGVSFFLSLLLTFTADAENTQTKPEDIRTTGVVLSGLIEAYSIYHFNAPIPYLGAGHFYNKNWAQGALYLATELGLKMSENHYRDDLERDFSAFPNLTTDKIYFSPSSIGYRQHNFKKRSYAEQLNQHFFNVRFIDFYDAYRKAHANSQSKIKLKQEPISSLILSPFKWKHIKNPWIFAPALLGGTLTYLSTNASHSILDTKKMGILGGNYDPVQGTLVESGIQLQRQMIVAASEEMYFRGVLQTELTEHTDPNTAIVLSALLFGAWHIPNNGIGNGISAGIAGLFFGHRYKQSGYDLGQPIAQHFWINFVAKNVDFLRNPKSGHFIYSITWKL